MPTDKQIKFYQKTKGKLALLKTSNTKQVIRCNSCKRIYTQKGKAARAIPCIRCEKIKQKYSMQKHQLKFARKLYEEFGFSFEQIAFLFETPNRRIKDLHKINNWKNKKGIKEMTVLSMDPGTQNFGLTVSKLSGNGYLKKITPLHSRLVINTVQGINKNSPVSNLDFLLQEVNRLISEFKPEMVIIERYQSRGFSSSNNEIINLTIGYLLYQLRFNPIVKLGKLLPPSTWKNKVNQIFDLKEAYKEAEKYIAIHQLDCTLMSMYLFNNNKNPYLSLKSKAARTRLYKAIQQKTWQIGHTDGPA